MNLQALVLAHPFKHFGVFVGGVVVTDAVSLGVSRAIFFQKKLSHSVWR